MRALALFCLVLFRSSNALPDFDYDSYDQLPVTDAYKNLFNYELPSIAQLMFHLRLPSSMQPYPSAESGAYKSSSPPSIVGDTSAPSPLSSIGSLSAPSPLPLSSIGSTNAELEGRVKILESLVCVQSAGLSLLQSDFDYFAKFMILFTLFSVISIVALQCTILSRRAKSNTIAYAVEPPIADPFDLKVTQTARA